MAPKKTPPVPDDSKTSEEAYAALLDKIAAETEIAFPELENEPSDDEDEPEIGD